MWVRKLTGTGNLKRLPDIVLFFLVYDVIQQLQKIELHLNIKKL